MLPYQTIPQKENGIAIVGIGGAGANVLQCFGSSSAEHVRLYTMSLDERVGRACGNVEFIQLGEVISRGLGSGGDPEVGRNAMEASEERVRQLLQDCKLLVLVVGLGGGTGSGAAPVLARMAREAGLFLVSVIMMPFSFEGKRRREQAELAHEEIARLSDIVFCFENDYMEELFRNRSGARAVFEEVDRLLAKATASVPMMATSPGLINLGLDELAAALENHDSRCIFGSGSGYGPERAEQAARAAVESPLATYHGALRYARAVIVHIAGGESMSLTEIRRAMEVVHDALGSDDVAIYFGATVKSHLGDEMRITLIASIDAEEFKTSFQHTEVPLRPVEPAPAVEAEPATPAEEAPEPEPEPEPEADEDDAPLPDETEAPADFEDEEEPSPEDYAQESAEEEYYADPAEDSTPLPPEPEDEEEEPEPEPAPQPVRTPSPTPRPQPAPRPEPTPEPRPEPAPAPKPAPAPAPAPAPRRQPPQQLDLFATPPMRQQGDMLAGSHFGAPHQGYPGERSASRVPGLDADRRHMNQMPGTDDWDTPPSLRSSVLNDIFPDN